MTTRQRIHTDDAPAALGPYSQAIAVPMGDRTLIFVAGQIPLDPRSGRVVEGPIEAQVQRVMENIRAILAAAGSGIDQVVKTTIFLADLGDFEAVNEAYGDFFAGDPPARSTVEVARLPKDVSLEIEVIACA